MCGCRVLVVMMAAQVAAMVTAESWSWPNGDGQREERKGPARRLSDSRQRYEVTDPDSDDFTLPHPEDFGPSNRPQSRPPLRPQSPIYPQRPNPLEPNHPLFNPNPSYRPQPGPGHSGSGVSKCKCSLPFNCEANSLQFGSCDAGKRYCCTKEARGPRGPGGAYGGRPGGPDGPAVLVGPGGPSGIRPPKEGVLVGPRPTHYRPEPAAGFSSSAPGPTDYYNRRPYRDYDNYNRRGFGLNE